jgi:hypothetical protein
MHDPEARPAGFEATFSTLPCQTGAVLPPTAPHGALTLLPDDRGSLTIGGDPGATIAGLPTEDKTIHAVHH